MKIGITPFTAQNMIPPNTKRLVIFDGDSIVGTVDASNMRMPDFGRRLYSFGLVSDIHFYKKGVSWVTWNPDSKFDNVLTVFENAGCVFCAHCGDITQTGLFDEDDKVNMMPEQFANYKEICDKHSIPVYGICGNHESYVVPITNNLTELKYYTGNELHYAVTQGEDVFLFCGQPNWGEVMSDDALQWLYVKLEENRNRRCFVFVHAYIEEDSGDALDVRENSIFESWGQARKTAFMNLLSHYKNTVLFHGHSHMKLSCQTLDEYANYADRNGFRSVHVPSGAYPRDVKVVYNAEGSVKSAESVNDNTASEGYIVDVYEKGIVLNGTDFITGTCVPLGVFCIDTHLQTVEANTFTDSTGTITT